MTVTQMLDLKVEGYLCLANMTVTEMQHLEGRKYLLNISENMASQRLISG